jgi:3'-phosphoadenosine 5'-phosphosulfate sulfotransferase (PAPS reductase)/FAD synthetase
MASTFILDANAVALAAQGALFVANHSGGKDSQAQLIKLLEVIPAKQILVAHATLGELEWPGALELARKQAQEAGCHFLVAKAYFKDGREKSLLGKVEHQFARHGNTAPSWPSPNNRWCTGELKTQPIEREVRRFAKEHGFTLIVNCLGERAQESTERKNRAPFIERYSKPGKSDGLAAAGRRAWNWLPIHALTTEEVFATIRAAGQEPHPAYAQGNERLSCLFCIYGSKGDLARAAKAYPEVYARYLELEARTGYPMHLDRKPLAELVALARVDNLYATVA